MRKLKYKKTKTKLSLQIKLFVLFLCVGMCMYGTLYRGRNQAWKSMIESMQKSNDQTLLEKSKNMKGEIWNDFQALYSILCEKREIVLLNLIANNMSNQKSKLKEKKLENRLKVLTLKLDLLFQLYVTSELCLYPCLVEFIYTANQCDTMQISYLQAIQTVLNNTKNYNQSYMSVKIVKKMHDTNKDAKKENYKFTLMKANASIDAILNVKRQKYIKKSLIFFVCVCVCVNWVFCCAFESVFFLLFGQNVCY